MTLTNINTAAHTLEVSFNVTWDNSWFLNPANPPGNYDAAWLVVKYHIGDNIWRTATLDPVTANHTIPAGFAINLATNTNPTRVVGGNLHRSSSGSGTATANGVRLKWLYGQDGIADSALITAEIHALEMVYVPAGSYFVGDGTTASYFRGSNSTLPFLITSTNAITAGTNAGNLRVGANNTNAYTISNSFPNGFRDFYIMKYEASQEQYLDFLNKTDTGRTRAQTDSDRQVIAGDEPDFVAVNPNRAALCIGADAVDYLDFVCLRPMTEFEYEKACRGMSNAPVAGEYAWGTAIAATLPYGLVNDGTATESVGTNYNENAGNCWYSQTQVIIGGVSNVGPCRVGMFAKSSYNGSTSPRIQSGAAFYGVMDMTGNMQERVVAAAVVAGDGAFNGEHGDGLVGTLPASWPAFQNLGYRGGSCVYKDQVTSTPSGGNITPVSVAGSSQGSSGAIRGVRTGP
jgi:formylglycine-generating enzyme required for sulfatase activity